MSWFKKVINFFKPLSSEELPNPLKEDMETVRARNEKGQYVADDLTTPDINEAYTQVLKKRGQINRKK